MFILIFTLQPSGRSSSESSDESDKWLPIFVAVTEREFRIYESAPWSVEAWSRPLEIYALATTRLAGAGNNSSLNVSQSCVFKQKVNIRKLYLYSRASRQRCSVCGAAPPVVSWSTGCVRRRIGIWPPGPGLWSRAPTRRSTTRGSFRSAACTRVGSVNWLCT